MRKLCRLSACDLPEVKSQALETAVSQGRGQGGRLARAWLTGGPHLPAPLSPPSASWFEHLLVPDTVFGAGNTRWARQARLHSPGASQPSGGDEPYTSAQAIKIWMLKVPGGDFPGGTVDKNLPASAGHTGSIPGLGRSHSLQSSLACEPQLPSLCAATTEPRVPRTHALQQEKSLQ